MEDQLFADTVFGVERVIRTPVAELLAEGGDQSGEGVPSRTDQMGKQVVVKTLGATRGGGDMLFAAAPHVLPSVQE